MPKSDSARAHAGPMGLLGIASAVVIPVFFSVCFCVLLCVWLAGTPGFKPTNAPPKCWVAKATSGILFPTLWWLGKEAAAGRARVEATTGSAGRAPEGMGVGIPGKLTREASRCYLCVLSFKPML